MRPTTWNPAEFAYWFRIAGSETRKLAWRDLTSSQKKLYTELDLFRRFSKAAGIAYEPDSELTLDPSSAAPPPPDLVCSGGVAALYFELGEVVEEKVAAMAARAERERLSSYGGRVDIWCPLLRIFSKKLRQRYDPEAFPLDLVLYYGVGRQASFWPYLAYDISCRNSWIQRRVDRGPFRAVWLYDTHADKVLARFASGETPFVRQFSS